jgi:DNA polymerase-3 subunit delta'
VGKTALARAVAQALCCSASERPCGQCRACKLIDHDSYADFRVVRSGQGETASDGAPRGPAPTDRQSARSIGIEQIRLLRDDAALAPYEGRWKVYVVADAQQLTDAAADALLKTLEEPPPRVVIILTAEDPDGLPPTIVSRCQLLRLSPVPADELEAALRERRQVEPERARTLARLAAGRPGWAIAALGDPKLEEERSTRLDDLLAAGRANRSGRFGYAEKLAQEYGRDPEKVVRTLGLWLDWWRDVLLARTGCDDLVVNWDRRDEVRRRGRLLSVEQISGALQSVEAGLTHLAQNANPRLALEVLLLDLPADS